MPVKVYYDATGKICYIEQLREAVFFVPEGVELDYIDVTNPDEPMAVTKSVTEGMAQAALPEGAELEAKPAVVEETAEPVEGDEEA